VARRMLGFMAICLVSATAWAAQAQNNPAPAQPRIKVDTENLLGRCDTLKPPLSPSDCKTAVSRVSVVRY